MDVAQGRCGNKYHPKWVSALYTQFCVGKRVAYFTQCGYCLLGVKPVPLHPKTKQ